jgi:hypothetical protein
LSSDSFSGCDGGGGGTGSWIKGLTLVSCWRGGKRSSREEDVRCVGHGGCEGLEGRGGRVGETDARDGWYDAGGYLAERLGASAGMGGKVFDLE